MKTLQWAAAALAVGALALPARAETTTTNNWWNVTFEPGSFQEGFPGLTVGELGTLTNDESQAHVIQPYASGVWSMIDGDESYVTNEFNPTNLPAGEFGRDYCIKLDTQGNDLTWTPTGTLAGVSYLVDADLYLVGSDSAPDASDFDADSDVQAAIYLKNETNEETGETTNSVLCVYVEDVAGRSYWQELKGVELEDNSWAHVQVLVNRSGADPLVSVFVNGTQMSARDGNALSWLTANKATSGANGKVNSVAFRGTGAVDNFAGKALETSFEKAFFKAVVYLNDTITNELCQVTPNKLDIGGPEPARFDGFFFDDLQVNDTVSYTLTKIEIEDFQNHSTRTYLYNYDIENEFTPLEVLTPTPDIFFFTEGDGDEAFQTGEFWVKAFTGGATLEEDPDEPITIVRIYFENLPEEGTYNAKATTTIGETTTTDAKKVRPSEFAEPGATKTITWEFPATKDGNVLSTTTNAALQADTLFAAATYVEGSLAEGYDLDPGEPVDGLYTFRAFIPPVAIYVAGGETHEYPSLRAAVAAASLLAEPVTIQLVADDAVSFTAENPILDIDFEVTIDGGSNTLYGMTDYAGLHEIRISGTDDVTIKDLKLSEFGDTAPLSQSVMPICTRAAYEGKLVLDGVTIDKFNRQALLLCGGEFLITNSLITGSAEGAKYFQSGIETYYAKGDVGDTTITGIGAKGMTFVDPDTDETNEWAAAVFTVNPLAGADGSVKVTGGYYEGQFIVAFNPGTQGAVTLEGGTFVATVADTEGAFLDDSKGGSTLTISGGWYDRAPAKTYTGALTAYQDAANAPDPAATWTVGTFYTITFNHEDDTLILATNVFSGTTGYGPAEDPGPVDGRIGVQFIGWTNKVDGGAVVLTANLPAADGDATWTAAFGPLVLQHVGAKSEEGFIILDPDDTAADDKQVEFTAFDPAAGAGTATATISAAMLNPNGATSVTLQLIYRTTLTGADQYVDAVVSDIDTTAGTATVTFTLPDEDTLFLIGFRNQSGVND